MFDNQFTLSCRHMAVVYWPKVVMNIVFCPKRSGNQSLCWGVKVSLLSFFLSSWVFERSFIYTKHSFIHTYSSRQKIPGVIDLTFYGLLCARLTDHGRLSGTGSHQEATFSYQTKKSDQQTGKMDYEIGEKLLLANQWICCHLRSLIIGFRTN